ncbi:MAG: VWA domain-containing protein [Myxococcales bacterium]|nr:VWA domain-containing protein [Myxococcales bacterium]
MPNNLPFGAVEFAANPEPRCPCVLVLDTSASMAGTRLQELQRGLQQFRDELGTDPLARKRVELAIITFGGSTKLATDFAAVEHFEPPRLQADGLTPMGAAVHMALDLVRARKQVYRDNGVAYYRPWVFLLTDGEPNDDWHPACVAVHETETSKQAAFFAVGVGEANFDVLRQISVREPLQLRGLMFREMFQWLSNSLKSVSHSGISDEVPLQNPTNPEGWAKI